VHVQAAYRGHHGSAVAAQHVNDRTQLQILRLLIASSMIIVISNCVSEVAMIEMR
jgi:hypothetical protein